MIELWAVSIVIVIISAVVGWVLGYLPYRDKLRKLRTLKKELEVDLKSISVKYR